MNHNPLKFIGISAQKKKEKKREKPLEISKLFDLTAQFFKIVIISLPLSLSLSFNQKPKLQIFSLYKTMSSSCFTDLLKWLKMTNVTHQIYKCP